MTSDYGDAVDDRLLSAPGVLEIKLSSQLSQLTQAKLRVEAANLVESSECFFLFGKTEKSRSWMINSHGDSPLPQRSESTS